jgi:IS5 family transposase
MVERSIAWLTRGQRRLRYRGVAKNNAWLHLRAAAINLRRLLTLGLHTYTSTWTMT